MSSMVGRSYNSSKPHTGSPLEYTRQTGARLHTNQTLKSTVLTVKRALSASCQNRTEEF